MRGAGRDESGGEESDGAGSDLDRLPDDSSSDDDLIGPSKGQPGGAQGRGELGPRPHIRSAPFVAMGDHRVVSNTLAPDGPQVASAAGQGGPHQPLSNFPAVHSKPLHGGAGGAAGARRPTATPGQRPAVVPEDPNVRRIKAQVMPGAALSPHCHLHLCFARILDATGVLV